MGWDVLKNGALMSQAEAHGFTAILTAEKGIKTLQKVESRQIAVVILRARNTRLNTQIEMIPELVQVLSVLQPGEIVEVFHPDMKS
jgi:hypothetical protein